MSVRDNIEQGVYEDLPWPSKPAMPLLLRTKAMNLTQADLDGLPKVMREHATAIAAYEIAKKTYEDDRVFKHKRFESDLATEHEVIGHKHRAKVFDMAWDDGHSEGLLQVVYAYERLVELLK